MRTPQHASAALPPTNYELAMRCISALIGIVVVVGLTATLGGSTPTHRSVAPIPATSLSTERMMADSAVMPFPRAAAVPPPPVVKTATKKPAKAAARKAVVKRWLPTGTGMWLHEWDKSNGGNARRIVQRAKVSGVSTLYVRGWSKKEGWEAPKVLRQLLPATKHSNIKVVVWEFAYLKNPVAEARRLAAAAKVRVPGSPRVVAVAPDIETAAEGTYINSRRVMLYMSTLRRALPKDVSILATVPWPSEVRRGHYPYAATAHYANALLPMTYWYNRSPVTVTASSIRYLKRYHRPVMPVGQGYDGRLDAPWLPKANIAKQVGAFLVTARRAKVRAISLWSWQTASTPVWSKLSTARNVFKAPAAKHPTTKVVVPVPVRTP